MMKRRKRVSEIWLIPCPRFLLSAGVVVALASLLFSTAVAHDPKKGFFSFGADQTIADIGKLDWQPLALEGLPPGVEIAGLRGDLAKGGAEILLRVPANYVVPNHSHLSDEVYVWLKGAFTYIAADGSEQEIGSPAYISLPGGTPHALRCGAEPCVFYLRYGRPFNLQVHPMPAGAASGRR